MADNGSGFDVEKADFGFGLYSIQERMRLLFADEGGMNVDSILGKSTRINIWIPFSEEL